VLAAGAADCSVVGFLLLLSAASEACCCCIPSSQIASSPRHPLSQVVIPVTIAACLFSWMMTRTIVSDPDSQ